MFLSALPEIFRRALFTYDAELWIDSTRFGGGGGGNFLSTAPAKSCRFGGGGGGRVVFAPSIGVGNGTLLFVLCDLLDFSSTATGGGGGLKFGIEGDKGSSFTFFWGGDNSNGVLSIDDPDGLDFSRVREGG